MILLSWVAFVLISIRELANAIRIATKVKREDRIVNAINFVTDAPILLIK